MTPAELHRWARPFVVEGFRTRIGRDPTTSEAQAEQGVSWIETRDGTAWKTAGQGSNNMGAIQSSRPPCDLGTSFQYVDTHPNPDGSSTPYTICFAKYPTPQAGFDALAREVYVKRPSVLAAASSGNLYNVSAALHATRYYEGFGKTIADRIENHYQAMRSAVLAIAGALGEPVMDTGQPPALEPWQLDTFLPDNPLILRGSFGPYVKIWQHVANPWLEANGHDALVVDGHFGSLTESATKFFQRAHVSGTGAPLKVDGKVGRETWAAAGG